jgi:hypothetical protein
MFYHADVAAWVPWLADHADEIAAALVLCLAAGYSMWDIWAWRGAQKLRRQIENLDSQGRQILELVVNEDEPVPTLNSSGYRTVEASPS